MTICKQIGARRDGLPLLPAGRTSGHDVGVILFYVCRVIIPQIVVDESNDDGFHMSAVDAVIDDTANGTSCLSESNKSQ